MNKNRRRIRGRCRALSVAITGLPASGKSTVLEEFRRAGFETVDADELARKEFYKSSNLKKIKKIFGTVDRKEIAARIFSDGFLKKKLERIIHPGVIKGLKLLARRAKTQKKFFAAEVPLLFEKKLERIFDISVAVFSISSDCLNRILGKKGIGAPKIARLMIKSHLPSSEKARRADFVLMNKSGIKSLRLRARKIAESLIMQKTGYIRRGN